MAAVTLIFSTIALGTLWLIADAQDARRAQSLDNITDDYSDAETRTAALASEAMAATRKTTRGGGCNGQRPALKDVIARRHNGSVTP